MAKAGSAPGQDRGQDPACPSCISMSLLELAPSRALPTLPDQLQGTGQSLLGSSAPSPPSTPTASNQAPSTAQHSSPGTCPGKLLPHQPARVLGQGPPRALHDWPCLFQGPQNTDFVSMDQMNQARSYFRAFAQANSSACNTRPPVAAFLT